MTPTSKIGGAWIFLRGLAKIGQLSRSENIPMSELAFMTVLARGQIIEVARRRLLFMQWL